MRVFLTLLLSAGVALGVPSGAREADTSTPAVRLLALPDGGIQPQAVMDDQDVLHVLYFKGSPAGGDLYYVCLLYTSDAADE